MNGLRVVMRAKFLASIVTFASFSLTAQLTAADGSRCYRTTVQDRSVNARSVTSFLDCLIDQPHLSKVAAQWIILKKGHWVLSDLSSGRYRTQFASNPMNPRQSHVLSVNFKRFKNDLRGFRQLVDYLEDDLFPSALRGFTQDLADNKTALSFEATVHQMTAYMDHPHPNWGRKEGTSVHYKGTLVESKRFRGGSWYNRTAGQFPVLSLNSTGTKYWPQLRSTLTSFKECQSGCLLRLERKLISGLFATLEHPELVDTLHNQLPRKLGCYGPARSTRPTGFVKWDFSLIGQSDNNSTAPDYTRYGTYGLLGRTIYIEGINKSKKKPSGLPGQFQGQAAIIRSIQPDAVNGLINLGGLGTDAGMFIKVELQNFAERNGPRYGYGNLDDVVDDFLDGASYQFADYQRRLSTGTSTSGHAVRTNSFFTRTIISKGHSLKTWADILHRLNREMYYNIIGYDFGFRQGYGATSYYDRLLATISQRFEKVAI